jgi:D-xylose 1-dehydrogenase
MATYPSLNGKRVLVTGGATGIGAEIVTVLREQNAQVVFFDIDAASGKALAEHTGAKFMACDLTETDALQASMALAAKTGGAFEVLVNNAANDDRHQIADVTRAYFDARIAVNLTHYFFAAQAVIPGMTAAGGGSIINLGSITSVIGTTGLPVYATAKGATIGMTRALAKELGVHNIRVNCVIPGWVKTERQIKHWITPEAEADAMTKQALKAWIMPRDLANMVVFLASDEAKMCTAQTFMVDAGWA